MLAEDLPKYGQSSVAQLLLDTGAQLGDDLDIDEDKEPLVSF